METAINQVRAHARLYEGVRACASVYVCLSVSVCVCASSSSIIRVNKVLDGV